MKKTILITSLALLLTVSGLALTEHPKVNQPESDSFGIDQSENITKESFFSSLFRSFSILGAEGTYEPGETVDFEVGATFEETINSDSMIKVAELYKCADSGCDSPPPIDDASEDSCSAEEWYPDYDDCIALDEDEYGYSFEMPEGDTWKYPVEFNGPEEPGTYAIVGYIFKNGIVTDVSKHQFEIEDPDDGGDDGSNDDGDDNNYDDPVKEADVQISGGEDIQVGESASFSADGEGEGSLQYEWYVDGSYEGTGTRFSKRFEEDGNYDIEVQIEDSEAQTASDSTSIDVELEEPTANIRYAQKPSTVETGDTVVLDASNSQDGSYRISNYNWRIAGNINTGTTIEYIPEEEGSKTIELEACDSQNNCDTTTQTLEVQKSTAKPTAVIQVPRTALIGETVQFDAAQSSAEAGIRTIQWEIGGQSFTGETVETTFQNTGQKSVTAIVEDQEGQTTRQETSIQITQEEPNILEQIWYSITGFFTA